MVVFFDLDDTLTDSESAHKTAILKICNDYSITVDDNDAISNEWLDITYKYLDLYFANKMTIERQRSLRLLNFFGNHGHQISENDAMEIYPGYHNYFTNSCIAFSDTLPSLERIRNHNIKTGIITNGTSEDQLIKLKNNNLTDYIDYLIISENFGISKPDKDIFLIAARQAQVSIRECLYTGDSFYFDYQGGTNAGMETYLLDRKGSNISHEVKCVHSLEEFVSKALNICQV